MAAPFKRRLGDRHDLVAFMVALTAGVTLIFSIRTYGDIASFSAGISITDIGAILVAITVIVLYGVYIWSTKSRSSVSIDRASDNIYYLGLIFTLLSLAYSLGKLAFVSSRNEGNFEAGYVISLLPDFGIALCSTIVGIIGRIVLQQARADPADIEHAVREDLASRLNELRGTVSQIIADMNGLSTQTNVTLTELSKVVSGTLEEASADTMHVLKTTMGNLSQFRDTADSVSGKLHDIGQLSSSVNDLSDKVNSLDAKFDKIPDALSRQKESLQDSVAGVEERVNTLKSSLESRIDKSTDALEKRINNAHAVPRKDLYIAGALAVGLFSTISFLVSIYWQGIATSLSSLLALLGI